MATRMIDRRVGALLAIFIAGLAIAVLRAAYLGSVRASALRRAAETEHVQMQTIPAARGTITDAEGTPVAISQSADNVIADDMLIRDPAHVAAVLAPVLGVPRATLAAQLSQPHDGYVPIARLIPADRAQEAQRLVPNGITLQLSQRRVHPLGDFAPQVLGWTNFNGQGAAGIEAEYNRQLEGVSARQRIVDDALGRPISVQTLRAGRAGRAIRLTLVGPLQQEAQRVIDQVATAQHARAATAIVMNPKTGAILALADWPTFDPSHPGRATPLATEDLATAYTYEPGSTFKIVAVSGAIQDGLITPQTTFTIPPYLDIYGTQIHDAETHGTETLTTAGILRVSSNIGADEIANNYLGERRFDAWMHRFGFGRPTGVDLPGEDPGIMPTPSQYSATTMYNLPFGQGLSVTPMQLINAYAVVANGGILRPPHIVAAIGGHPVPIPAGHRIISPATAAEMRSMFAGVFEPGGTAYGTGIPGWDIAGKTGTSNIAVNGVYSQTAFNASFVAMVPASDPKLLALVVVDQPQGSIYGGSVAAPAVRQILGWAVPYFGINPR
jgi:cell division protein FtsI (penicillin-binding protein 3)